MTWTCPKCLRRNSDDNDACIRCGRQSKDTDQYE